MINNTRCKLGFLGLAAVWLIGCGKEVGRVPFSSDGTNRALLGLASGKVAFWTDLDLEYVGVAALEYRIDLLQAGRRVATAACDPLGEMPVKSVWFEMRRGPLHATSGRGKMACSANLPKAGPTTIEATLTFDVRPAVVSFKKADLVIKQ